MVCHVRKGASYSAAIFLAIPSLLLCSCADIELPPDQPYSNRPHVDQGFAVTSHAAQGKTVDQVIVSVPIDSFCQANEAQLYVSMSRAREAMHLFTDGKVALKEAVTRPSSRLSPLELMVKPTEISRIQSASSY